MEEIRGLDPARTELVELVSISTPSRSHLLLNARPDQSRLQLPEAAVHRRIPTLPCVLQFWRRTAVVRRYPPAVRPWLKLTRPFASQYLESLCDYLYDDLRPRILHESRLSALCEVCTVIQALMVLDIPSVPDSPSDEDTELDELSLDLDQPRRHRGLRTLHISHLLQMVLQDAQTRLFFKAQSVIQSEIRYYVPKPEDLQYPDKLVGESPLEHSSPGNAPDHTCEAARRPPSGAEIREKQPSVSRIFQVRSWDKQETWYPTLQKTIWVLSQLHEFVKVCPLEPISGAYLTAQIARYF